MSSVRCSNFHRTDTVNGQTTAARGRGATRIPSALRVEAGAAGQAFCRRDGDGQQALAGLVPQGAGAGRALPLEEQLAVADLVGAAGVHHADGAGALGLVGPVLAEGHLNVVVALAPGLRA